MKNERLISLREKFDLTQEGLANNLDISQSMVARIEAGDREPRKLIKTKLAKFFGVTVEWLFYEQIDDHESYNTEQSAALDTGTEG